MRILHTGDNHFRKKDFEKSVSAFMEIVNKANDVDIVVIAGDIFDSDFYIGDGLLNRVYNLLYEISSYAPIVLIRGNHDPLEAIKSLGQFDYINSVHVVTEFSVVDVFGAKFYCFPYIDASNFRSDVSISDGYLSMSRHYEKAILEFSDKVDGENNFAIGHFSVSDVVLQNKQKISLNEPVIDRLILENTKFDAVFLGHIHNAHQPMLAGTKIRYCGSHYPTNFGETSEMGFWIYDTRHGWEWHKTNAKPNKVIELSVEDLRELDIDSFADDNAEIKFKINVTESERATIPGYIIQKMNKIGKVDLVVKPVVRGVAVDFARHMRLADEVKLWCDVNGYEFTDTMNNICLELEEYDLLGDVK